MNRQSMIKQAQLLQKKLLEAQENLETLTVEATAGGGMVKAIVNGKEIPEMDYADLKQSKEYDIIVPDNSSIAFFELCI